MIETLFESSLLATQGFGVNVLCPETCYKGLYKKLLLNAKLMKYKSLFTLL